MGAAFLSNVARGQLDAQRAAREPRIVSAEASPQCERPRATVGGNSSQEAWTPPAPVEFKEERKGAPMTKGWAVLLSYFALAALAAGSIQAAELRRESGRLADLITLLASKQYVLGEPTNDPRPYVDPTPALNAFRHLAAALAWGDVNVAARKAAEFDYEVVRFEDVDSDRRYYVLRENLDAVETLRGWGSYIMNPQARVDALVEVPHPMADVHTPEIGGQVFDQCEARGFLLAGTHREKADVPDLVDSIFHQVHAAWIGPAARVAAWQIHGFASSKHPFPRGAQVVASAGDGAVSPEIAALDAVLEERGLASYVFNELPAEAQENQRLNGGVAGVTFTSLAAAKNEQGRLSRSLGGSFVHIELEGNVRATAASRSEAGAAIAAVINKAAAPSADRADSDAPTMALSEVAPTGPRDDDATVRLAAKPTGDADPAERQSAGDRVLAP
jgi:hypothetical protein